MVYQRVAHYLWLKGDTYYFNRRVPKDVQAHYKASRIVICLRTSRKDQAIRAARSIAQRLEDYWLSLRLANIDVPAFHLLSKAMTASRARHFFLLLFYTRQRPQPLLKGLFSLFDKPDLVTLGT